MSGAATAGLWTRDLWAPATLGRNLRFWFDPDVPPPAGERVSLLPAAVTWVFRTVLLPIGEEGARGTDDFPFNSAAILLVCGFLPLAISI